MEINYYIIDVFAEQPFDGASVHVFIDDHNLTDNQMRMLTEEFHAVDSVFVKTDTSFVKTAICYFAQKRSRLASHTVIAATQVLANHCKNQLSDDDKLQFVDEYGQNFDTHVLTQNSESLVTISQTVKPVVDKVVPIYGDIAESIGLIEADIGFDNFKPLIVDSNGPYLVVPIKSYNAVRAARIVQQKWIQAGFSDKLLAGVMLFSNNTDSNTADFHTRLISSDFSHHLDPPIASLMPGFTSYLCAHSHLQQGTHSFELQRGATDARQSHIHVEMDHRQQPEITFRLAGAAMTNAKGTVRLP